MSEIASRRSDLLHFTREAREKWNLGLANDALASWIRAHESAPSAWWTAMEAARILRSRTVSAQAAVKRQLFFSPNYASNSYQSNLYTAAPAAGFQVMPIQSLKLDDILGSFLRSDRPIYHQHWLKEIYWLASDVRDGIRKVDVHVALLKAMRAFGVRICWTLHNLIDHDASEVQRTVCKYALEQMASVSDVIFIHTRDAGSQLSALCGCDVSSKLRLLEHTLYTNLLASVAPSMPPELDKGLFEGKRILLSMGMIRPYKGVGDLLEAMRRVSGVAECASLHLIVAGRMMDPTVAACIKEPPPELAGRVSFVPRELKDGELAALSQLADVSVTPYRKILTSGSFYLTTTFSKPTLAPARGMFKEVLKDGVNGLLYDGTTEGLAHGLLRIARMPAEALEKMGHRVHAEHRHLSIDAVSTRFFEEIESTACVS